MNNILTSINTFLEYAKKNILWSIAFVVFGYLFFFLLQFLPSVPNQIASFEKGRIEIEQNMSDGNNVDKILATLEKVLPMAKRVEEHFNETLKGTSFHQSVNPQKLNEGIEIVTMSRRSFSFAIGTIQGIEFHNSRLADFKRGFESDLRSLDTIMASIEQVYLAKLSGEMKDITETARNIKIQALKNNETLAGILSRLEGFNQEMQSLQAKAKISIIEQTATLKWFYRKYYFAYVALIYETAFILVGFRAWFKSRVKKSDAKTKPPRTNETQPKVNAGKQTKRKSARS